MRKSGLVELEAVVAIARLGSFRAAALNLDMSPTAIGNILFVVEQQVRPFYMVEGYADAKTSGSFGVTELKGGNQLWTVVN